MSTNKELKKKRLLENGSKRLKISNVFRPNCSLILVLLHYSNVSRNLNQKRRV